MSVTGFTRNQLVVRNALHGRQRPGSGGSRIVVGLTVAVLATMVVSAAVVDQTDGVSARTAELQAAETERDREVALDSPGSRSQELGAFAAELHEDALVAWSVAASRLDVAGIEAGLGHVPGFLPARGLEGELTDDH